ncbi:hypothetical protein [uncultured Roseobacter sp.]|uniref:hypothetical protein n=1 Tax=uncultured Roseobacter sp. TaxID=114847 RepID=UPI002632DF5B|nr:hypothetical protein [uncultured Roseobacter sp.]
MTRKEILWIYLSGLTELALCALGWTILLMLPFACLLRAMEQTADPGSAFLFVFSSAVMMALWPGQSFWTIERRTRQGQIHSIIGRPSDDDIAAAARIAARHDHSRADVKPTNSLPLKS